MVHKGAEVCTVMKDSELIKQMEALEEVIDWLEKKGDTDLKNAEENAPVDEDELDNWLQSPDLEKVRKWLDGD